MNGRILGFQRRVWWPKWTPASSSWRIETDGTVDDLLIWFVLRGPRIDLGPRGIRRRDGLGTIRIGTVRV
jgi:hypothetical protein